MSAKQVNLYLTAVRISKTGGKEVKRVRLPATMKRIRKTFTFKWSDAQIYVETQNY